MTSCVSVLLSEVDFPGTIRALVAEEPEGPGWKLLTGVPVTCDVRPRAVLKAPGTSREPLDADGVTSGTLTGMVGKIPLELVASEPVLAPPLVFVSAGVEANSVWLGATDFVGLGRSDESDSVELVLPDRRSDTIDPTRPAEGVDDGAASLEFDRPAERVAASSELWEGNAVPVDDPKSMMGMELGPDWLVVGDRSLELGMFEESE